MKAKKEKDERDRLSKGKKKEELDALLVQYGGLWRTETELVENKRNTGGSHLSRIFWEHENLSSLSIIWLIQLL